MAYPNLNVYFETSKKVRGGKFVWFGDSNGEERGNTLLGSTIANPPKGFGYLYAAQLYQYNMGEEGYIFRSFAVKEASAIDSKTIVLNGDGYSDLPEVGMILMIAPTLSTGTGQSGKVTSVVYDSTNEKFTVTLDTAIGALTTSSIIVEAIGSGTDDGEASATATVLVPNPNTFIEADTELMPTNGAYGITNVNYSISTVYKKQAFTKRMQPLPQYVLAKNRSYIDGIFWI